MRIVLFGEDSFSAIVLNSLLQAGHDLLAVCCPLYDNYIHARLESICIEYKIPFHRINNFETLVFQKLINDGLPDIIVICHFQKIIKPTIINLPKMGCINLHPSLLPKYRGMSPQHWPIINGDKETGITVHFVDQGVDTGDIIIQEKMTIADNEYVFDLQRRMMKIYGHIVVDALNIVSSGNGKYTKQSHLIGSYYGKLKLEHCWIDIEVGILAAYNLIRAVSYPYLGARIDDKIIWRARLSDNEKLEHPQLKVLLPGFHDSSIIGPIIKFNDGILIVEKYNQLI